MPSQLTTGDRGGERGKTQLAPSAPEAMDMASKARLEALKKAFLEIDFEDNKFVPNLKRIPQNIQQDVVLYV